jgi:hypothetical protein
MYGVSRGSGWLLSLLSAALLPMRYGSAVRTSVRKEEQMSVKKRVTPKMKQEEVDLVLAEDEAQPDQEARSQEGGRAILAGHTAERLRRLNSSLADYQAEELEKIAQTAAQSQCVKVVSGEVTRDSLPHGLLNTLEHPTIVTADASEHRTRLASEADVLEMALDAAATIEAQISVEKMQAHHLALAHKMAMHFGALALKENNVELACKLGKASLAAMHSYTQGQDSIHRARRGGRQIVTVQRVNVNDGGRAVIAGQVNEPKDVSALPPC